MAGDRRALPLKGRLGRRGDGVPRPRGRAAVVDAHIFPSGPGDLGVGCASLRVAAGAFAAAGRRLSRPRRRSVAAGLAPLGPDAAETLARLGPPADGPLACAAGACRPAGTGDWSSLPELGRGRDGCDRWSGGPAVRLARYLRCRARSSRSPTRALADRDDGSSGRAGERLSWSACGGRGVETACGARRWPSTCRARGWSVAVGRGSGGIRLGAGLDLDSRWSSACAGPGAGDGRDGRWCPGVECGSA